MMAWACIKINFEGDKKNNFKNSDFSRKSAQAQGSPLVGGPLALGPWRVGPRKVQRVLNLGYVTKGQKCQRVRR